jgi:predicted DNA-binding transcriptional regulator AlpA
MDATRQRSVEGPAQDFLTLSEVVKYLRLSKRTLRRLVAAGEFPRPLRTSPQTRVWDWEDLLFWRLKTKLGPRLRVSKKKPAGQSVPPAGQGVPSGKRGAAGG